MKFCVPTLVTALWVIKTHAAGISSVARLEKGAFPLCFVKDGREMGRLRGGGGRTEPWRGRSGRGAGSLDESLTGISLSAGPDASLRMIKRSKQGFSLLNLNVENALQRQLHGPDTGPEPWDQKTSLVIRYKDQTAQMFYSADGRLIAQMEPDGVCVYSLQSGKQVFCCRGPEGSQLQGAHLTPKGSFLVTCSRPARKNTDAQGAAAAWTHMAEDGEERAFSPNEWPYIQWTNDESYACLKVKDGIEMITKKEMLAGGKVVDRLEHKGMTTALMTPNVHRREEGGIGKVWVGVFVKGDTWGDGGRESEMQIFEYPGGFKKPFVRVGLGLAEECTAKWAYDGSALLVLSTVVVDEKNDYYYGKTRLQFVRLDEAAVSNVKLDKEGPVHDASWSPNTREFIVVYGTMPARACLFNYRGQAQFSYGAGNFNSVTWSPHGRFFVLGGFGSLPGKMQFWDKTTKKKLGEGSSPCTIYKGFSPCSRFFITAVTFPGLRVDNEIKVWKYDGTLLHAEKNIDELYQCEWLPCAPGSFVDRSASPDVIARATELEISKKRGTSSRDAGGAGRTSWGSFSLHDEERVAVGHVDAEQHERLSKAVEAAEASDEDYRNPDELFGEAGVVLSKSQKKRNRKKAAKRRAQADEQGPED